MMHRGRDHILAEAIAWHVRLRDDDGEAWEAFTCWLEADPAHAEAYDALARADHELDAAAIPAVPAVSAGAMPAAANDDALPARDRRLGWGLAGIGGLAGALLLLFVALGWPSGPPSRYEVATRAGERLTVDIGDGSRATLNGATRLILDRGDPRTAELAEGEAVFSIRHDAARPFRLAAGDHRLIDAGTTFNVVNERQRLAVEVIDGAVLFDPQRDAVRLGAGETLTVQRGAPRAVRGRRDPSTMAGWRSGRLDYRGASLGIVVADLARSLGARIDVEPRLSTLPFTGSIRVEGGAAGTLPGFAATLGLEARPTGRGWRIESPSRARN